MNGFLGQTKKTGKEFEDKTLAFSLLLLNYQHTKST